MTQQVVVCHFMREHAVERVTLWKIKHLSSAILSAKELFDELEFTYAGSFTKSVISCSSFNTHTRSRILFSASNNFSSG